jgi:hypothetical protein
VYISRRAANQVHIIRKTPRIETVVTARTKPTTSPSSYWVEFELRYLYIGGTQWFMHSVAKLWNYWDCWADIRPKSSDISGTDH